MAKENGIGMTITIDDSGGTGRDISNDILDANWNMPRAQQDITGLDKSAMERLALLADFRAALRGVFNDAANKSHAVLKNLNTGVLRTVVIAISGQTLTNECLGDDYALNRGADGSFVWNTNFMLADGTLPAWS